MWWRQKIRWRGSALRSKRSKTRSKMTPTASVYCVSSRWTPSNCAHVAALHTLLVTMLRLAGFVCVRVCACVASHAESLQTVSHPLQNTSLHSSLCTRNTSG